MELLSGRCIKMAAAAEVTVETFSQQGPVLNKKLIFFTGTGVSVNDFVTVTPLTTVQGCYFVASDGTIPTFTFATNVITFIDLKALVYQGIIWGV